MAAVEQFVSLLSRTRSRALVRTMATACVVTLPLMVQAQAPTMRYRVASTSVLSLDRAPQPALVDTVQTTSLLSIATTAAAEPVATLSIDSLQQTSTGMVRRTADAFSHGTSIAVPLQDGRARVVGDSATACSAERPLAALLPELLPLLPTPLRAEQQWSDTLTVTTCRSGLPVTMVTTVNYRTLTGMDSSSVLLERRAFIRATGATTIREQLVSLTGTGTAESLGVIHVMTRQLQSLRGTQTLEFQLTNGQQTRRMTQQISDTVTVVPSGG